MNRRTQPKRGSRPHRPAARPGGGRSPRPQGHERSAHEPVRESAFRILERSDKADDAPFRIVIAVHRPRFRGRAERAAALVGWEVTALLNKQDPVGLCAKAPRPPDLLVLSGDFGRQKDLAIFRAVQRYRSQGLRLIGLVDDCQTPPEGFPDSVPDRLCDICLEPPYRSADLRALFARLYEEIRGKPAPPPVTRSAAEEEDEEDS